ncbi:SMP-30/gluconolactonase/LRE family protein [Actinokineospora auranticolor]|uniref:SMP-30/gluconolaconase/LRE-like protein n=1 Tax=Actinokineospora auranticolor TaxID=155976 RepID=A0A2S6GD92_9PSEU|nr:SMP-30/gluconolactonase/LRE family protein [Actinokineospora auranticolor]PPK63214.1 SMP-30/gluconolaconase/LRE-like protein [Actinokineospora auranticolor]
MTRRIALFVSVVLALFAVPVVATAAQAPGFPDELRLPDGFRPEGIAIGRWPVAYFGSLADGRIHQIDLRTGTGRQLSPPAGGPSVGLKVDTDHNRLFVAGGTGGEVRVIDTHDGKVLARYKVPTTGAFLNDVTIARDAVWFTDSNNASLYELPLGPKGELPDASKPLTTLPLTGDWQNVPNSFNGNGIVTTPDGKALIVGQTATGKLFRVDPATGAAKTVDIGTQTVTGNDGQLRLGRDLYVMENGRGTIAKIALSPDGTTGTLQRRLSDYRFDTATTIANYGESLYAVNARFSTPPTPTTTYTAVSVPRF